MKVCVLGLGYVGLVTSVCLAKLGHVVHGVDIDPIKIKMIQRGKAPFKEPHIEDTLQDVLANRSFTVTPDTRSAICKSEISLICVGTPTNVRGSLHLRSIKRVCVEAGTALRGLSNHHVVVRSTVLPGTTKEVIIPLLERFSGKKEGRDFNVSVNPEFLREGASINDFYHPVRIIIGSNSSCNAKEVSQLYNGISAETIVTDRYTAEMIKYVDNAFHGLKVAFANEIARICTVTNVDAFEIMEIFSKDTKLNLSKAYLRPGFAFGGSCIPKDLRALNNFAKRKKIKTPLLNSVLKSNEAHIDCALETILRTGKDKVGIFGLSFKEGSDDLRESSLLKLASSLLKRGKRVKIYDKNLSLSEIHGANERYLKNLIQDPYQVIVSSPSDVVNFADVIVIGHNEDTYIKMATKRDVEKIIVDLIGALQGSELVNYYSLV